MIDQPKPFDEVLETIARRIPRAEPWDSADWGEQKPAVRVRAFFSATVEDISFLDRAKRLISAYLNKETEEVISPDGSVSTALKVGSRADFVEKMQDFAVAEGMADPDFSDVNPENNLDTRSSRRLNLIFDTNVRTAYGYGQWRQGMTPEVRRRFPAARFVRLKTVQEARPIHDENEDEVRLKTDYGFWRDQMNAPQIGGFGVPWAPYGYNSGMDQEDVTRREALRLGLLSERSSGNSEATRKLPPLNEGLKKQIGNMSPELRAKLLRRLQEKSGSRDPLEGGKIEVRDGAVVVIPAE